MPTAGSSAVKLRRAALTPESRRRPCCCGESLGEAPWMIPSPLLVRSRSPPPTALLARQDPARGSHRCLNCRHNRPSSVLRSRFSPGACALEQFASSHPEIAWVIARLNLDAGQRWSGAGAPICRCICMCICVHVRALTAYVCRDPLTFGIVKTRPSPAVGARARPRARCSVGACALAQAPAVLAHLPCSCWRGCMSCRTRVSQDMTCDFRLQQWTRRGLWFAKHWTLLGGAKVEDWSARWAAPSRRTLLVRHTLRRIDRDMRLVRQSEHARGARQPF